MKPFRKDILDDISLIDIDHCEKIGCHEVDQQLNVKEKQIFCNIYVYAHEILMLTGEPANHTIPKCCQYTELLQSIVSRIEESDRKTREDIGL